MIHCMSSFAQSERSALCDTFLEVGPDAPTLSGSWRTRDLAAHLILRERRPDAAIGMFLAPLAGRTDKIQASLAQRPFEELVDTIRSGPPKWNPMALGSIDEAANLGEFFVHHEDVLRGVDPAARRQLDPAEQKALFGVLSRMGMLTLRSCRVGVVADSPGYGRRSLRSPKDEHGNVVMTGEPGEIVLYLFGRGEVADVELDGADHDVAAFRETDLGV